VRISGAKIRGRRGLCKEALRCPRNVRRKWLKGHFESVCLERKRKSEHFGLRNSTPRGIKNDSRAARACTAAFGDILQGVCVSRLTCGRRSWPFLPVEFEVPAPKLQRAGVGGFVRI